MALADRPPGRFLRLAMRLPTWLYRVRLGWLLGSRFICLMHRGRRSGRVHRAIIEVVRFDGDGPEAVVMAGWGERTQWYRNLEAAPAEEVRIGRRRWRRPGQRFLGEDERIGVLGSYVREHPLAARELLRLFGADSRDEAAVRDLAGRLRAVAFRPSPDDRSSIGAT